MKFSDLFHLGDRDAAPKQAVEKAALPQETPQDIWFSLCDDPNQEEKLNLLLAYCYKKGGKHAVTAALEELCQIENSVLPKIFLARMALQEKDISRAIVLYADVLVVPDISDYALFLMSADLGQHAFPEEMIELLCPHYQVDANNIYIGLNLLQAFRETKRAEEGEALLAAIRRKDNPDIHTYLEDFERSFATMRRKESTYVAGMTPEEPPVQNEEAASIVHEEQPATGFPEEVTPQSRNEDQAPNADETVTDASEEESKERPLVMPIPIWRINLPGLTDIFPSPDSYRRVGVYLYADTTYLSSKKDIAEGKSAKWLCESLPLYIGEQLLFTAHSNPIVLFPTMDASKQSLRPLEPDVQSLFALCSKESLDYMITGTITFDNGMYRTRTWILDRAKQSARIVTKDILVTDFGRRFLELIREIMLPFTGTEQSMQSASAKPEFTYSSPDAPAVASYLRSLGRFASSILSEDHSHQLSETDEAAMLQEIANLASSDPQKQTYLMMLLSAMYENLQRGSNAYILYRKQLYDAADKLRYLACIRVSVLEINRVFAD